MRTRALESSSLALATSALGRACKDSSLVHESGKLYVRSLAELQRALWNPRLVNEDETLATCLTLSLYEMMECPGDGTHAYGSHCRGLLALIERRGPRAHISGLGRQLFLATRLQGVCCLSQSWISLTLCRGNRYYTQCSTTLPRTLPTQYGCKFPGPNSQNGPSIVSQTVWPKLLIS